MMRALCRLSLLSSCADPGEESSPRAQCSSATDGDGKDIQGPRVAEKTRDLDLF